MSMTWIFVTVQRRNFVTPRESISTRHLVNDFKRDIMVRINRRTSCICNDGNEDDENIDDVDVETTARGKVTRRSNGTRLADT